ALDIQETARGIDDPDVATTVFGLGELYAAQNQNQKAEPMFKLAMSIREATGGMESPEFGQSLERYAQLLEKMGRGKEAERHRKLAAAVKTMRKAPAPPPGRSRQPVDLIAPTSSSEPRTPRPLPTKGKTVARI